MQPQALLFCAILTLLLLLSDNANSLKKLFDANTCGYQQADSWVAGSPWLVEMRVVETKSNLEFTKCAGVIINERYVLSVAQCFLAETGILFAAAKAGITYKTNVTVGAMDDLAPYIVKDYYAVQEFIPHPLYDEQTGANNIALLRLQRIINPNKYIQPICLPENNLDPKLEPTLFRATWAKFEPFFASLPRSKDNVPTKLIKAEKCNEIFERNSVCQFVSPSEMCTEEFSNVTEHYCNSFLGSPLMSVKNEQFYLEGLLTNAPDCKKGLPGVYINVSSYMSWIKDNVRWFLDTCQTPEKEISLCVPLTVCPNLLDAFANPRKGTEEYWNKYICSEDRIGGIQVCCPSSLDVELLENRIVPPLTSKMKLSDKRYCGYQHRDDYVLNSTDIAIDEYPWLATIRAVHPKVTGEFTLCSGSLINKNYVLTSAHCLVRSLVTIVSVRLGEYNLQNKTDCVIIPQLGEQDCNVALNYGIEKVIIHPFYNYYIFVNDIALVKLNGTVIFDDYIRPICLPTPSLSFVKTGDILYTTSFASDRILPEEALKKKLAYQLMTDEVCQNLKPATYYHMCLLPFANSTNIFRCFSDDGAPASFSHRNQWTLEGLSAERISICDVSQPVMLTRISMYLKWLKENLV